MWGRQPALARATWVGLKQTQLRPSSSLLSSSTRSTGWTRKKTGDKRRRTSWILSHLDSVLANPGPQTYCPWSYHERCLCLCLGRAIIDLACLHSLASSFNAENVQSRRKHLVDVAIQNHAFGLALLPFFEWLSFGSGIDIDFPSLVPAFLERPCDQRGHSPQSTFAARLAQKHFSELVLCDRGTAPNARS